MYPSVFDYPKEERSAVAASQLIMYRQSKPQPNVEMQMLYNVLRGIYNVCEFEEPEEHLDVENALRLLEATLEETSNRLMIMSIVHGFKLSMADMIELALEVVQDFRYVCEHYPAIPPKSLPLPNLN